MSGIDFYIYVVISLLGVAYPLLLQVIARLDEKYSSDHIVELFDQEWEGRVFKYTLISSLVFIGIWTLKFEPFIHVDGLNYFINNSAAILLTINSSVLVVLFFLYVDKILVYYTPARFIHYLRTKHNSNPDDLRYFQALSDILLLSIKSQNSTIAFTLSEFFSSAFKRQNEVSGEIPVVFPELYYELTNKAVEDLAILKDKRVVLLERIFAGSRLLLGQFSGNGVSEESYRWMWGNLRLLCQYERDDMVVFHWETAHDFLRSSLPPILSEFGNTNTPTQVSNQSEIDARKKERGKFLEFHFALGGLLLYSEMHKSLRRLFSHTTSLPPKYELLPYTMDEIFNFYMDVNDPYERKYPWISHLYPFPDQNGLWANSTVKKWLASYMALLFLRQYTLHPYLITMHPLEYPTLPGTQGEIKQWIERLDFFQELVEDHLNNMDLLKAINFDFITRQWCTDSGKPYPLDFIEEVRDRLNSTYKSNATNLPIDREKEDQFLTSTERILGAAISDSKRLHNETLIEQDSESWYVGGRKMVQSRDAFLEHPEVHHIDFDSFLASATAKDVKEAISETFLFNKSRTFVLKEEDIFKGIDRLKADEEFVIINFGLNIDLYINQLEVGRLTPDSYKGIGILSFKGGQSVRHSLFILRKSDLPNILTREIPSNMIEKYSLTTKGDHSVYASVIDLNNANPEILEEIPSGRINEELSKSVLECIFLSIEIRWKKQTDMVQIIPYSPFIQQGLMNGLDEIKAFEDTKK